MRCRFHRKSPCDDIIGRLQSCNAVVYCQTGTLLVLSQSALVSAGFEKPSAIQQKGIVPFGKGLDVIQQAQSGTGKTATFCAGILQNLDYNLMECQALVLAPTRELAQQIEKVMRALGDYQQVKTASLHAVS